MKIREIEDQLNILAEEVQTAAQHVRDYRTSSVPALDDLATAQGLVTEAIRGLTQLCEALGLAYQSKA